MKAFIKDCTDLSGRTKAFINVESGSIKEDRLTKANSSFVCTEISTSINVGDIFILINDQAKILYYGKITSISNKKINTSQILSLLDGTFIYSIVDELKTTSPSTYLEEEIAKVINNFKVGNLYESSYVDDLINQQIGSLQTEPINSLEASLPSDKDDEGKEKYTSKEMSKWLYELYDTYGIVFDFNIPIQEGTPRVKIWKPNYSAFKITDGFECVSKIEPKLEEQSTNKLVVYWSSEKDGHMAKEYRTTFVLTKDGIVEEPATIVGRPNEIKTTIVYSDDAIEDVKLANLSEELFNHKIDFSVNLNSKLFSFDDLKLDLPVQIYDKTNYYYSIITGRQFTFNDKGISDLKITCGKVRTALTSKLLMGIVQ